MIVTLLNFLWIFLCAFVMGVFTLSILPVKWENIYREYDLIIIMGVVTVTVYAEVFSLFHRVAALATLILFGLCLIIVIAQNRKFHLYFLELVYAKSIGGRMFLFLGIIVLYFAIVAVNSPDFYDSALYHGQAIRWIEKFGVVKGLGNLHNRFAYNSSFLCLQALFSWNSLIGQSLHGMNAFIGLVMTVYAISSLFFIQRRKFQEVDLIYLLMLFYIASSVKVVASPITDFMPMLIVLYIFSKWMKNREKKQDVKELLCIIAIFGVTIKLSIAPLSLLVIKPLTDCINKREWKKIGIYFAMACIVVMPFLIRNYLISGYLIYPFAQIDLFDVDWKMPNYTVLFDNHEITAWGRGLNDARMYSYSFFKWFPTWLSSLNLINLLLLIGNALLILGSVIYGGIAIKHKNITEHEEHWVLVYVSIICLLLWIFSAPLVRYGYIYLFLLPALWIGFSIEKINNNIIQIILIAIPVVIIIGLFLTNINLCKVTSWLPNDYPEYECYEEEFQYNKSIYIPLEGDRTGYKYFPAIPYKQRLFIIEMRGEDFEDGFRMKKEYKDANVTTYGTVECE